MYGMTNSSESVFSKLLSFLFSSQSLHKRKFITVAYAVTGKKRKYHSIQKQTACIQHPIGLITCIDKN